MTANTKRASSSGGGKRKSPLGTTSEVARRMIDTGLLAGAILLGALGIGVVGYHMLCGFHWLDALLNASMILGGMGPVDPITTTGGKWFASIYALVSGVILIGSAGVFFSPLIHQFLHKLHLDTKEPGPD